MKLAVMKDDGTVIDTYEGVSSDDITSTNFGRAIQEWLNKTLVRAELDLEIQINGFKQKIRDLEAELRESGDLEQAAKFTN